MDSFFATPLQNKEPTRLFLQCHCKSWFAWGSFFAMLFQIQQHWECFCNAIAKLVFLGCFFAMPLQFQDSLGVLLQCRCKSRLVWGSCFSKPSQIQKLLGVFVAMPSHVVFAWAIFLHCPCKRRWKYLCNAIANQGLLAAACLQCNCKCTPVENVFSNAIANHCLLGVFFL